MFSGWDCEIRWWKIKITASIGKITTEDGSVVVPEVLRKYIGGLR